MSGYNVWQYMQTYPFSYPHTKQMQWLDGTFNIGRIGVACLNHVSTFKFGDIQFSFDAHSLKASSLCSTIYYLINVRAIISFCWGIVIEWFKWLNGANLSSIILPYN